MNTLITLLGVDDHIDDIAWCGCLVWMNTWMTLLGVDDHTGDIGWCG